MRTRMRACTHVGAHARGQAWRLIAGCSSLAERQLTAESVGGWRQQWWVWPRWVSITHRSTLMWGPLEGPSNVPKWLGWGWVGSREGEHAEAGEQILNWRQSWAWVCEVRCLHPLPLSLTHIHTHKRARAHTHANFSAWCGAKWATLARQ